MMMIAVPESPLEEEEDGSAVFGEEVKGEIAVDEEIFEVVLVGAGVAGMEPRMINSPVVSPLSSWIIAPNKNFVSSIEDEVLAAWITLDEVPYEKWGFW